MIPSRPNEKPYTKQMIAAIIAKNRGMRNCFSSRRCFAAFALAVIATGTAFASDARHVGTQQVRVRSVVRADAKTGRLVRSYVVNPRLVPAKVASAHAAENTIVPAGAPLSELVESVATKYEVDPLLVHSVIQVDSGYNPHAVSHKGAQGLMQLMPATARRFGVTNSFDAVQNLEGGVRYLKYLDSLFPNDLRLTLAAYNAGEGAVWKYGNNIPPYRETEQYVYKVGARYGKAVKQADKAKKAKAVAQSPTPVTLEPTYAHVESFVDATGRLHLRTAPRASEGLNTVSTP
jgi:soluble lytic murein transglycosylase-like protein